MKSQFQHRKQRGFFELGIGLLLFSIFGTTAAIVNENSQNDNQRESTELQHDSIALYCHQSGGSFLPTPHPLHAVCCYTNKCLHIDSDRGVSEILISYKQE